MTFGEKIREARKSKKLTQRQLSERIGAAHNSVSDWENDKNKPDPDTIELLCGVLEITPNYLLASAPEEFTPYEVLLIKKYRSLDQPGREHVDTVIQWESDRAEQIASVSNQIALLEGCGGSRAYSDAELRALSIDEKVDLYRQELEREEKVAEESEAS